MIGQLGAESVPARVREEDMFVHLFGVLLASPAVLPSGSAEYERTRYVSPYIEVWTHRDDVFRRGDRVRVQFRTDLDAYVTVFRVDTDGRVRVLFPLDPWDDNFARGGRRYEIETRSGNYTFRIDDYPGRGYVFAVASADPFNYSRFAMGDHWDYRAISNAGRITGDPYVAFAELIEGIVPPHYRAYSYDVTPYYVEQRYEYPRFLCYDCHAYAAYPYWNPYRHSCFKFRVVIYDDPYYYPARTHVGTRVVYQRPVVIVPRYVFKDRSPGQPAVVTVRERPVDASGRRRIEPGVTARDIGGVGRVAAPTGREPSAPAGRLAEPRSVTGAVPQQQTPRAQPEAREPQREVRPQLERRDPRRAPEPEERRPEVRPQPQPRAQPQPRTEPSPPARQQPRPEPRATPQRETPPSSRAQPAPRRQEPDRPSEPRSRDRPQG